MDEAREHAVPVKWFLCSHPPKPPLPRPARQFSNHTLKRDTEHERENQGVGSWHGKRAWRPLPLPGGSAASLPTVPAHQPFVALPAPASVHALSSPPGPGTDSSSPAVLPALQEAIVFVDSLSPDTEDSELATKSSESRTAPASE